MNQRSIMLPKRLFINRSRSSVKDHTIIRPSETLGRCSHIFFNRSAFFFKLNIIFLDSAINDKSIIAFNNDFYMENVNVNLEDLYVLENIIEIFCFVN